MVNILDYGARNGIEFDATKAFQAAVDACKDTGGTVFVPCGIYTLASVHLYSNVHICFENGVRIFGSLDPDDYDPRETIDYPLYQDASHSYFHRSMFWAENCDFISFTGNAVIDMREVWENTPIPGEGRSGSRRGANVFAFKECTNLVFTDMTLLHATDIALYIAGCENVKIRGLTLEVNIDGISPDCCSNVVISDCNIVSGDDSIVLKSSYTLGRKQVCENITVTNCTVSSGCNAIKLGTESNGGFRNIAISNCTIYNTCLGGISVETTDGGDIDGVVVSNITMKNVGNPIFAVISDRARGPEPINIGSIRNVIMDNIVATGPYTSFVSPSPAFYVEKGKPRNARIAPCACTGDPKRKIENLSLSNIYLTVPGGGTIEDKSLVLPEISKAYPQATSLGERFPVYGMFFRHIKELRLHNIHIDTLQEDQRDPMLFEDVDAYNNTAD